MATVREIAGWLGAEAPAGAGGEIGRVSALEDAGPESVVFATDERAFERALQSAAGCVLVSERVGCEAGPDERVLRVRDAKLAFARVAKRIGKRERVSGVHPGATVEEDVEVGAGTWIGPGVVIEGGVRLGAECEIRANATIYAGTVIGDRVVVQAGAVLGTTGFGYVRDGETGEYLRFPQQGRLVIEDDVEVGANTTIDRGALGETRIGRGTKIDNLVHIAHNCLIGRNVVVAAQTGISGSTVVGDGAVIGGQVGIGDHAEIGEGVVLGSGSGVLSKKKLRGAGQVFWGIPAQPLKSYLRDLARMRRG